MSENKLYCYGGILQQEKPGNLISKAVYGWRWSRSEDEALGSVTKHIVGKFPQWAIRTLEVCEIPGVVLELSEGIVP
jgi:hypothetical protein